MDRRIAKRYASALFSISEKYSLGEKTLSELSSFVEILQNDKIVKILKSPNIRLKDKEKFVENILQGRTSKILENFLYLLLRKRRILYLNLILEEFRTILDRSKNLARGIIKTVILLDDIEKENLKKRLENVINKELDIKFAKDSEILAGLLIKIEDKVIDWTARGYLDELKEKLGKLRV